MTLFIIFMVIIFEDNESKCTRMYQPDDTIRLEVRMEDDTVCLTQQQMADLFQRESLIVPPIKNVYQEEEPSK